ncbi:hypothetical protein QBC34DRAFT_381542 [Podospora aff. communis PSN243]|uniref:Uncharacterized protein n=1 Tax=Podospora aff. communis PSN243 TaxID=3040156 RepID=A0AAV9GKA1_9PEZI|nr:hypothetical protein QBC34DRAFT_381542 [Podospora aff. communis PSN243]
MPKLHDILWSSISTASLNRQQYLTFDVLRTAITADAVNSELSWTTRLLAASLANDVTQRAKRLFAALCLTGEPRRIKSLLDDCLEDLDLSHIQAREAITKHPCFGQR